MMNYPDLSRAVMETAKGRADFPMTKGSFRYIDEVRDRKALVLKDGILSDAEGRRAGWMAVESCGNGGSSGAAQSEEILRFHLDDPSLNRFYLTFPTDPDEHYYGCGETFSAFDLKGKKVRIWVAEHQNAERIEKKLDRLEKEGPDPARIGPFEDYESYYAQPTLISSGRWAMHVDGTGFMSFDLTVPGRIVLELRQEAEIRLIRAESFAALSERLSGLLGRVPELPEWLFDGMILGIQQGPEVIEEKLERCRKHGVKVCGIWSQDWCGCRRTGFGYQVMWNWVYDGGLYPGLPEKIIRWRERGIRFLGYINPFLAIEKEIYREASEKGYCVKNAEGGDYLVTITTFPAAMIDFTNPEAYAWYKELIKKNLIGIGMSGWMADFGEYLPTDCVLYDGSDPELMHNAWPAIWARMNREAIEEAGVLGEVFFFTRAGFTETIRYSTMMWNGDQHVDFSLDDGLASVIPATLSLAMSGYGVAHSDAGGYTTMGPMTRGRELIMRWEEMNAFSPLMRSHEGNQPARSVQFDADDELLDHLAHCVRMHTALKPYLRQLMREEAEHGTPVMRPLFYHYNELRAFTEKYEYLLGRDVLAAPVIVEGAAVREVYLPEDRWVHLFTGREYGGGTHEVPAPIGQPPVFVRRDAAGFDLLMKAADLM